MFTIHNSVILVARSLNLVIIFPSFNHSSNASTSIIQSSSCDYFIVSDSYYADYPVTSGGYCDDCDCEEMC